MEKENDIFLSIILRREGTIEKVFTVIKLYLGNNTI